ncbi:putative Ig domain-containing protein [Actinokineospora pegani]|uniref:putative Ig domain-containing protein n=1 Tax=Actinokineospora pegani TaxID=2654637 RepID=UPI001F1FCA52|nr:putative Ig domain-containing protein [Actinokineospora pegani]
MRNALVTNGTTGKLTGINTGSPDVLLYTAFRNGGSQPGAVTVANPGNRTATAGQWFTLDNRATGRPAGLFINSSTGRISGTPTAATANVTVTATDAAGKVGSATFIITVSATGGGCAPATNGTDYAIADLYTTQSPMTVSGCTGRASASSTSPTPTPATSS